MARFRELTPGVLLATSDIYMTNTVAVVHESRALLIDPAVLPQELDSISEALAQRSVSVELGFATHAHWDHLLWPGALLGVPRFASAMTVELVDADREGRLEAKLREAEQRWYTHWKREPLKHLAPLEGSVLEWAGPPARPIVHDAHVPGHTALHFADLRLLVAADMVSDIELPLFDWTEPEPLQSYLRGLDALAAIQPVDLFVPGHGRPGDGSELERRIAADRAYVRGLLGPDTPTDPRIDRWPSMRAKHEENLRRRSKEAG
jgi:hydroxyacylglutathione hydrolase